MYANKVKKVAAVHDCRESDGVSDGGHSHPFVCGFPGVSVAYSRIVEPYPVSGILFSDLTDEMPKIISSGRTGSTV